MGQATVQKNNAVSRNFSLLGEFPVLKLIDV